jgi:hypothetical protein
VPIDPVTITPPAPPGWIQAVGENLVGLKAIHGVTLHARPDLAHDMDALIARGETLKTRMFGAISGVTITYQNADQVYRTKLEPIESDAYAWLHDVQQFATRANNQVSIAGIDFVKLAQDAGTAADDLGQWANDKIKEPIDKLKEFWAGMQALLDDVETTLAGVPWMWIGIGVLAIFLVPPLLRAIEGDE